MAEGGVEIEHAAAIGASRRELEWVAALSAARAQVSQPNCPERWSRGAGASGGSSRLRHLAQLLRLGERLELLQALVLDLADALARDVERAPDLVERARVLATEAVTQL